MTVETPESKLEELYKRVTRLETKCTVRKGLSVQKTKAIGEVEITTRIENLTQGREEVKIALDVINKDLNLVTEKLK